jgi:hypothetical protein
MYVMHAYEAAPWTVYFQDDNCPRVEGCQRAQDSGVRLVRGRDLIVGTALIDDQDRFNAGTSDASAF